MSSKPRERYVRHFPTAFRSASKLPPASWSLARVQHAIFGRIDAQCLFHDAYHSCDVSWAFFGPAHLRRLTS